MLLYLLFVYFSFNFNVGSLAFQPKIIGGSKSSITKYPFIVSIQRRKFSSHVCGGSYIAPRFILTAAHCIVDKVGLTNRWRPQRPNRYLAVAGTSNLQYPDTSHQQVEVFDKFFPHRYFRFEDLRHDIALCRMKNDFKLTEFVQFSQLPLRQGDNVIYQDINACSIAGWGKTDPHSDKGVGTDLYYAQIPLIPDKDCRKPLFRTSQLCAGLPEGGVDSCQGDSGGPLVCNGTQVAITSHGYEGCAKPNNPGVYTRIDFYLIWIKNNLNRNIKAADALSFVYFLVPFFFIAGFLLVLIFYLKKKKRRR